MASFDIARTIFTQIDTNQDGIIDQNEFRSWATNNNTGATTSSYESAATNRTNNQGGLTGLEATSQSAFESSTGFSTSYAGVSNESTNASGGPAIQTSSAQQTNEYLAQSGASIFNDPNPQIIRRATTTGPVTYEQKIYVRFLQPPPVPPPGPLIIKEVRPPPPPPPPPLIVRQQAQPLPALPPLVLRERPPEPPAAVASETVIRRLPPVPVPPRSVIIERLPPLPPKPRDIIIERWVPYGPETKRRTIVQPAPPAVQYPRPRNIIVVYDTAQARVIRKFQRFSVTPQNPQEYVARYGASLLDAATLVQQARAAGVVEDISPPSAISSTQFNSSASFYTNTAGTPAGTGTNIYTSETANAFTSSSSNVANDSAFADSVGLNNPAFDPTLASFAATDTNKDGQLDEVEFRKFLQDGSN